MQGLQEATETLAALPPSQNRYGSCDGRRPHGRIRTSSPASPRRPAARARTRPPRCDPRAPRIHSAGARFPLSFRLSARRPGAVPRRVRCRPAVGARPRGVPVGRAAHGSPDGTGPANTANLPHRRCRLGARLGGRGRSTQITPAGGQRGRTAAGGPPPVSCCRAAGAALCRPLRDEVALPFAQFRKPHRGPSRNGVLEIQGRREPF